MHSIKSKTGAVAPNKSSSASGKARSPGSAAADRSVKERANSAEPVHKTEQLDWVIDEAIRDFEHARRVYRMRNYIRALNATKPWSFT